MLTCRLYNAAVHLNCSLADLCKHIDILSLGGTKNGLMFGEALVFFNHEIADGFLHLRKQGLQLHSKMRYISAQFQALFTEQLWYKNAKHANQMATLLTQGLVQNKSIKLIHPVQTNQVFVSIPSALAEPLQKIVPFYTNGPKPEIYRMVTSFDSNELEVNKLLEAVHQLSA